MKIIKIISNYCPFDAFYSIVACYSMENALSRFLGGDKAIKMAKTAIS